MSDHHDFPVSALREAYPGELPAGSLFKFRGFWAFRVEHSEEKSAQAFVVLQGPHAGMLLSVSSGMARALSLTDDYAWFPGVAIGTPATSSSWHTGSIAISIEGPLIVGGDEEGEHYAFGINGRRLHDYSPVPAILRFDRWTAHLVLKTDPFKRLAPIFSVDRRAQDERD